MHLLALPPSLSLSLGMAECEGEQSGSWINHTRCGQETLGGRAAAAPETGPPSLLPFLAHQEIGRRHDGHREGEARGRGAAAAAVARLMEAFKEGRNRRNRQSRRRRLFLVLLSFNNGRAHASKRRTHAEKRERERDEEEREGSKKQARGRRASRGERARMRDGKRRDDGGNRKRRRLKRVGGVIVWCRCVRGRHGAREWRYPRAAAIPHLIGRRFSGTLQAQRGGTGSPPLPVPRSAIPSRGRENEGGDHLALGRPPPANGAPRRCRLGG